MSTFQLNELLPAGTQRMLKNAASAGVCRIEIPQALNLALERSGINESAKRILRNFAFATGWTPDANAGGAA